MGGFHLPKKTLIFGADKEWLNLAGMIIEFVHSIHRRLLPAIVLKKTVQSILLMKHQHIHIKSGFLKPGSNAAEAGHKPGIMQSGLKSKLKRGTKNGIY